METIQSSVRMVEFILLNVRRGGKHAVSNSYVQMTSRLKSLWTSGFFQQSFVTPVDTFLDLDRTDILTQILPVFFENLKSGDVRLVLFIFTKFRFA